METYSNIICKRKKPQARNFSLQFNTFLMQHKNTNSLCPMYVRTQCAKVFEAINTLKWHWSHIHTYTHSPNKNTNRHRNYKWFWSFRLNVGKARKHVFISIWALVHSKWTSRPVNLWLANKEISLKKKKRRKWNLRNDRTFFILPVLTTLATQ